MKQSKPAIPDEPVSAQASPPPTDAQWYSYLASMARGEMWPGSDGQERSAQRHIRAALDKVNSLETENAKLREALKPFVEGAQVWKSDSYSDKGHRAFTARSVSVEAYDHACAVLGERSGK